MPPAINQPRQKMKVYDERFVYFDPHTMMLGYLSAFGYVFLLLISIYCFGYAARRSSLLYVLLLQTLLGVIIIFPLLFLQKSFRATDLFSATLAPNWVWLSVAALFGFAGGNYFTLLNLRTAGEKINSLLSPAITALTVVLSYFVFRERLHLWQWAGIVFTLFVVVYFLLNRKQEENKAADWKIGMWSGIATVVCLSLAIISSIKGVGTMPYFGAIWLRLLFALVLVLGAFLVRNERKCIKRQPPAFYGAILGGVLADTVLGNYLFLYASFKVGISVFQVILATFPLWVYAVDVYVLKKSKPSLYFFITALLALAGILLVIL